MWKNVGRKCWIHLHAYEVTGQWQPLGQLFSMMVIMFCQLGSTWFLLLNFSVWETLTCQEAGWVEVSQYSGQFNTARKWWLMSFPATGYPTAPLYIWNPFSSWPQLSLCKDKVCFTLFIIHWSFNECNSYWGEVLLCMQSGVTILESHLTWHILYFPHWPRFQWAFPAVSFYSSSLTV